MREDELLQRMHHLHQNAPFVTCCHVASQPERIPALRQSQARLSRLFAQDVFPRIALA